MDKLDNLAYEGVKRYFRTLSKFGYKSYKEVNKLIVLLFIEDFLREPFNLYIDEKDYKVIANTLYSLFGSTCLIPYPEFVADTSLVQALNVNTPRITEDNILRFNENELIKLLNE